MVDKNIIVVESLIKKGEYFKAWQFIKILSPKKQLAVIDEMLCQLS